MIGLHSSSPNFNEFASLALGSRDLEASRIDSCLHYDIRHYQAQLSVGFIIACDEEKCCWRFQLVPHGDACRSESGRWGKVDQGIYAYIYVIFPSACLRAIIQQCRAELRTLRSLQFAPRFSSTRQIISLFPHYP